MKLRGTILLLEFASLTAIAQFPPQIKNIVVIVQENRTPDNLFHYLTPACPLPAHATGLDACTPATVTSACYDIASCGVSNQKGTPVAVPLEPVPIAGSAQPEHSHWSFEKMCDPDPATLACRNDGAWQITKPEGGSYGYVENAEVTNYNGSKGHLLDPYLAFAKDYGWANYMYQTNQGPSYSAHQFIFSGTSAATAEDDANSTFIAEDFANGNEAGCLAEKSALNSVISPALSSPPKGCSTFNNGSVKECTVGNAALIYPTDPVGSFCHSHQTMASILDARSITWKYYAATAGVLANAPDAAQAICDPAFVDPNGDPQSSLKCAGREWSANVDIDNMGTNILRDIYHCDLANVSWVTPDERWSDHAGGNDQYGPSWVAAIVNAIGTTDACPAGSKDAGQTYWENTAIVVTWDDWGGWADHEIPHLASTLPCKSTDCPADFLYGFRVPMMVISAYTPAGLINNEQYDFGSILRMIEGINHGTEGELGFADKRATNDLHEFFTLEAPRKYHIVPSEKDATWFMTLQATPLKPDDE